MASLVRELSTQIIFVRFRVKMTMIMTEKFKEASEISFPRFDIDVFYDI